MHRLARLFRDLTDVARHQPPPGILDRVATAPRTPPGAATAPDGSTVVPAALLERDAPPGPRVAP